MSGQGTEKGVELIPVLERLRPRRLKDVRLPGRIGTKLSSSIQSHQKERLDKHSVKGLIDPLPKQTIPPTHEEQLETSVDSQSLEVVTSGDDKSVDAVVQAGERVLSSKVEEGETEGGKDEQLVPHVPKLRRTYAMCVSNEAIGRVNSPNDPNDLFGSHNEEGLTQLKEPSPCLVVDPTSSGGVIKTKRIQRKRPRRTVPTPSTPPPPNPDTPTTSSNTLPSAVIMEGTSKSKDTSVDKTDPTLTTESSVAEDSTDSAVCGSGCDEWEYPQPSTNYQKMQRQLARQKQLKEMQAREAAYAREERFLRRQGLSKSPEKHKQKRLTWKEESELVEVFSYSPCSSRGSTLEPDEIPE